jgi:hypothetical protein
MLRPYRVYFHRTNGKQCAAETVWARSFSEAEERAFQLALIRRLPSRRIRVYQQ